MESRIAHELELRYEPVATLFVDEAPSNAARFPAGEWGCVAKMHVEAAKGQVAAFDAATVGCPGGAVGLGLSQSFREGMAEFLSTGSAAREGEAYWKTPDIARSFMASLPLMQAPKPVVVFKPLNKVSGGELPELVTFYATSDQLSALIVLAHYGRPAGEHVVVRSGAGCHTLVLIPMREALRQPPRAVIGMFDISARKYLDPDLMAFTVPLAMFEEMEANVAGSFLDKESWREVRSRPSATEGP